MPNFRAKKRKDKIFLLISSAVFILWGAIIFPFFVSYVKAASYNTEKAIDYWISRDGMQALVIQSAINSYNTSESICLALKKRLLQDQEDSAGKVSLFIKINIQEEGYRNLALELLNEENPLLFAVGYRSLKEEYHISEKHEKRSRLLLTEANRLMSKNDSREQRTRAFSIKNLLTY